MLLFVYNADSGKINSALDIAHKILSPHSYQCSLCSLTHGVFKEKDVWKRFRQEVSTDLHFYHRDEFEQKYPHRYTYPVILQQKGYELSLLLSHEDIEEIFSVENLIEHIKRLI